MVSSCIEPLSNWSMYVPLYPLLETTAKCDAYPIKREKNNSLQSIATFETNQSSNQVLSEDRYRTLPGDCVIIFTMLNGFNINRVSKETLQNCL